MNKFSWYAIKIYFKKEGDYMYNGILPVYKERGLTSHDVVFKLRKILKTKK